MPVFSNSSSLKSVFEKLRFSGDALVWTEGLTVEIKPAECSNSSEYCGRGLIQELIVRGQDEFVIVLIN